jgi:hypothetical protein
MKEVAAKLVACNVEVRAHYAGTGLELWCSVTLEMQPVLETRSVVWIATVWDNSDRYDGPFSIVTRKDDGDADPSALLDELMSAWRADVGENAA